MRITQNAWQSPIQRVSVEIMLLLTSARDPEREVTRSLVCLAEPTLDIQDEVED